MVDGKIVDCLAVLLEDKEKRPPMELSILNETQFSKLGLDSLDQIEFMMAVESMFNIEFLPHELKGVNCAREVAEAVQRKLENHTTTL